MKQSPEEMLLELRHYVDEIDRHLKLKQLYGAYKAADEAETLAFRIRSSLASKTTKAALDFGLMVSSRKE